MTKSELVYLETLIRKLDVILAQKVPLHFERNVDIFEERVNMFEIDIKNFKDGIECHIEAYCE